jgi:hypothetical protein
MKTILLLTLAAASVFAADATGKWAGTLTLVGDNGGKVDNALLVLKQDGAKLTGTAGPDANQQNAIQDGKAENGNLTFDLPFGGGMMKFVLKQLGEELTGDVSAEREGQKMSAKLALKREK